MAKKQTAKEQHKDVVDILLSQAQDDAAVYTTVNEQVQDVFDREPEGQLSVDLVDTEDALIVVATVAGADPENISVHVHNDVLTIRGSREAQVSAEDHQYVHRECFWGRFSRTIILPLDVKAEGVKAVYKNGVLIVSLPKDKRESKVPITVVES